MASGQGMHWFIECATIIPYYSKFAFKHIHIDSIYTHSILCVPFIYTVLLAI